MPLVTKVTVQTGLSTLPFGGIGTSGIGNYHGKFTFDTFSQSLPVSFRPALPGTDFGLARYHPYRGIKGWLLVNGLLELPYMPVVRKRAIAMSVALVGLGWWVWPSSPDLLPNMMASATEILSKWKRSDGSDKR